MKVAIDPVPAAPAASAPILEAVHVTQRFGGLVAVDDVSLSIAAGEVLGLIGPNGAGKSTLFDVLAGERRPSGGQVLLRGKPVQRQAAEARLAGGLGRTFQIPRPFAALSLLENVMLGATGHPGERLWPNLLAPGRVAAAERAARGRALEILAFLGLERLAREPARVLSGGQRKLLELARVLMAEPAVVLLDEPAAGVHPALMETIGERLATLARGGLAVLVIEHHLGLIAELCGRAVVMVEGRVLCSGTPAAVLADPRVAEAYIGRPAA
jgi:branched-chain amino acid transport system ATP-binding protein